MAVSSHYEGAEGARYAEYQLAIARPMGAVNARKFARFIKPTDTVLDFGCGGGFILLALPCANRIGVEPAEAALAVARSNRIEAYPSTTMVGAARVDVVISHHALEHTTRPLDELRALRNVLKHGGRLVLVLPLDDWRTQRRYELREINHHLYAWTPQLLGNLVADAGFRVEQIMVVTHAWPPGAHVLRRLPAAVFDACCFAFAVLRRRRQIQLVAVTQ